MAYFFPFSSVVFTKQFIHVLTTLHDHPVLYILSSTISFGPTKSPCRVLTTALFYSGQASTIGIYGLKVLRIAGISLVKKIKIIHVHEHVSIHALSLTHTHTLLSGCDRKESR